MIAAAVVAQQSLQKSVLLSTDQDIELIRPILLLSGFYNRKGFILSQHPLDSTISSMWQMVAEQEIQVIVVLTNLDNQVRDNRDRRASLDEISFTILGLPALLA